MSEERRALGRGLAALIGDADNETAALQRARSQRRLPVEMIRPNPRNPRVTFETGDLDELAQSIREKGVVQPILVRPADGPDSYEIIAGERRWRAAQRAGLHEVPVIVHAASDQEALELAIIENVQRTNLNAMEEARGYQRLVDEFGYTQAALADVIGKSRPHVANTIRLLKLPQQVQDYLAEGKLSAGHARALINASDPGAAAKRIVEEGLTVRDAETLAAARPAPERQARMPRTKDADTTALERAIGDALGLAVTIAHKPNGGGELRIRYSSLEQLDEVCRRLQSLA
jgi:ParB family chromosome partitioning protein